MGSKKSRKKNNRKKIDYLKQKMKRGSSDNEKKIGRNSLFILFSMIISIAGFVFYKMN